jgi:hypothetical protein
MALLQNFEKSENERLSLTVSVKELLSEQKDLKQKLQLETDYKHKFLLLYNIERKRN